MMFRTMKDVAMMFCAFRKIKRLNRMYNNPLKMVESVNKVDIPIMYINLDRCKDRRKYMEEQFEFYGILDVTRINGIDGKNLVFPNGNTGYLRYNMTKINTLGEYGCTFSHIKAILMAYQSGYESVLIVEDDCDFMMMDYWYCGKLSDIFELAPKDWEILQIFSLMNNGIGKGYSFKGADIFGSTCAYVINRVGMGKFLDKLRLMESGGVHYFGKVNFMADSYIYKQVKTYCVHPSMLTQNIDIVEYKSTMGNIHDMVNFPYICRNLIDLHGCITDFVYESKILDCNVRLENMIRKYKEKDVWFCICGKVGYDLRDMGYTVSSSVKMIFEKNEKYEIVEICWRDMKINIVG